MEKAERIDKILSHLGVGSRSEVRQMIKQGKIRVNDTVILDDACKIYGEKVSM